MKSPEKNTVSSPSVNKISKEDSNTSYGDVTDSRHLLRGHRSKPSKHTTEQASPVFVQFLDCVYQIMQQHPTSFEFSETFILHLLQIYYSGITRTFMGDYEKERIAIYRNLLETFARNAKGNMEDIEGMYIPEVWDFLLRDDDDTYLNPLYVKNRGKKKIKYLSITTRVASLSLWRRAYCGCLPNTPASRESRLEIELRRYKRLLVSNSIAVEEEKEEEEEEEETEEVDIVPPALPPRIAKQPSNNSNNNMVPKAARMLLGTQSNVVCPELPPRNPPLTPSSPRARKKIKSNLITISTLKVGDKIAFNKKTGLLKIHSPSLGKFSFSLSISLATCTIF
jgi:hypothetical protein